MNDETKDLDGIEKNFQVIKKEWFAWKAERKLINEKVSAAWDLFKEEKDLKSLKNLFHNLHAYTEEIIDKNPRVFSYLAYPRRIFEGVSIVVIVRAIIA